MLIELGFRKMGATGDVVYGNPYTSLNTAIPKSLPTNKAKSKSTGPTTKPTVAEALFKARTPYSGGGTVSTSTKLKQPVVEVGTITPYGGKPEFLTGERVSNLVNKPTLTEGESWSKATQSFKSQRGTFKSTSGKEFKSLTELIKHRGTLEKGSNEYNEIQSVINRAYGKGKPYKA